MGPTSARLLARGHSDDSPAHYQFRYSREASDLRTGGGHVTPMRTVPAHTPASGDQSFSETVSDLSPGHLWFVTVCGGDAAMHPDLCNHSYATYPWEPEHFFTTPSRGQDYVLGSHRPAGGTPPWLIVSITTAAASGPQGQAPDGYLTWENKGGEMFFGRVTCLLVDGSRAAIGAVGQDRYFGRGPTPRPCWRPSRMAWSRGSTSSPG